MSTPPPGNFGKYQLIDRLGRGGMADVWRARVAGPQGFARVLVLKRILPHLVEDKRARELFEREARVVSRLSHANIVQVYEFGEVDGEYYLAMEHVDGRDLAALIRAGGSSPALAAFAMREVCRALAHAHELRDEGGAPLRILHRDVSPSNVMLGYDGSVRLLDFGIAKAFADARDMRTVKGTIRGKFGYIAPEVLDGLEPDGRADLFSVGVVLHEALSGKRLFRGTSDIETLALVKRAEIPLPSTLNPAVSPALDAICMKALARDRDQRYASSEEMAHALDAVVHELRFGPAQLADAMNGYFPRDGSAAWAPQEDSGERTFAERRSGEAGLGTARTPDPGPNERPTTPMPAADLHALVGQLGPTDGKGNAVRVETKETVPGSRSQSGRAAPSPVPRRDVVRMQPLPAPSSSPRATGLAYIGAGALLGVLITCGLLFVRVHGAGQGPAVAPAALDLSEAPRDLAVHGDASTANLLFPSEAKAP